MSEKITAPMRLSPSSSSKALLDNISAQLAQEGKEAFLHSLDLVEIDWEMTPIDVLARLIKHEAVHKMDSIMDLKLRLKADRRIYALLHPDLPLEPLIFVQVAFTSGLASSIQAVLEPHAEILPLSDANTALFYSISNAQPELKGLSFGNFLIKQVVARLARQHQHISQFATLSPIPGFRSWLDARLASSEDGEALLQKLESQALRALTGEPNAALGLASLLGEPWHKNGSVAAALKPILMRLCKHYLLNEQSDGKPRDPVANFHLFNGARVERLNWLADISQKAMLQSAGIMVNYVYQLSDIDENHHLFMSSGKIVASNALQE